MSILDRVFDRVLVENHDGRSGARIERGVFDGCDVYVKTAALDTDIGLVLTSDALREARLLKDGVFDRLPDGVGSALIAVEETGTHLVTVTRDLGRSMLSWDRILTPAEVRRILTAITSVHRSFLGDAPAGLCPLATRLSVFAPANLAALTGANAALAEAIARGHEAFAEIVPAEIVTAVHACYDQPAALAAAARGPATLLHGDFFLPNIALQPDVVTPTDWSLATAGPAPLDVISFCVGAMSNVAFDREALLAEARSCCNGLVDDDTFSVFEFWALMELGWNKALDAADHPDEAKRATERADLDFWVGRARSALDRGLVPG